MSTQAIERTIFHSGKIGHGHPHYPDAQWVARGKEARKRAPRATQSKLDLTKRTDPLELLARQARSRVPELIPIRYGRMMVSPFTFFRGAALVMASDLSHTPSSGIRAQICGDAHLLNFGMFGTAERRLVFDVNDFDETLPGPWEWDVKRLAASLEVAGRSNGYSAHQRRAIVVDAVRCYHETMAELAGKSNLEVWYARIDVESTLDEFTKSLTASELKMAAHAVTKAFREDNLHALDKLTKVVHGKRQIVSNPPLLVPMRELAGDAEHARSDAEARELFRIYRKSLPEDRGVLFDQFRFVELARKVVGVGSVGTRCWVALFLGIDNDDPLFLQIKEADASVLERFAGRSKHADHAQRVVAGQRLMQAESDLLLGWGRVPPHDFYIRQLHDWKGSFPVEQMRPEGMSLYGRLCAWTLARAHARSGNRVAIASYLGTNDRFEEAIATFSVAYADQNEKDHAALVRAVRTGLIQVNPEC